MEAANCDRLQDTAISKQILNYLIRFDSIGVSYRPMHLNIWYTVNTGHDEEDGDRARRSMDHLMI